MCYIILNNALEYIELIFEQYFLSKTNIYRFKYKNIENSTFSKLIKICFRLNYSSTNIQRNYAGVPHWPGGECFTPPPSTRGSAPSYFWCSFEWFLLEILKLTGTIETRARFGHFSWCQKKSSFLKSSLDDFEHILTSLGTY